MGAKVIFEGRHDDISMRIIDRGEIFKDTYASGVATERQIGQRYILETQERFTALGEPQWFQPDMGKTSKVLLGVLLKLILPRPPVQISP
jgi:hypothetical protein